MATLANPFSDGKPRETVTYRHLPTVIQAVREVAAEEDMKLNHWVEEWFLQNPKVRARAKELAQTGDSQK